MVSKSSQPPNVIFILSDDQGYWTLGCQGNPDIRTPHLDRLAASGIRFDNFFCTSPVCSPARASLLTGRMPSQHGIHDWLRAGNAPAEKENGGRLIEYLEGQKGYTDILAENGYCCGISGKWHLGDSLKPQKSLSYWEVHAQGAGPYYNAPMVRNGEITKAPGYVTHVITDNALEFLSRQEKGKPFYLSIHYTAPHAPWERRHHPPEIFNDYYEHCGFESFPQKPTHPWQASFYCPRGDPEKRREFLSGYSAAVTAMDRDIGRILDGIEERGIASDTLVFFVSDNGMNMGHHGIYGKGNGTFPMNMFDTSVKVPAIISHPGQIPQGQVCRDLLSQCDFMPTLLDYLGFDYRRDFPDSDRLPGRSFASLLGAPLRKGNPGSRDHPRARDYPKSRDFVVVYDEYGPVRMIRTTDWKYIHRYPYGPHELYDLRNDPQEDRNLVDLPDQKKRVQELRGMLEEWFLAHVDPERDGAREPVTGRGQIDMAGKAGAGRLAFLEDWKYLKNHGEAGRSAYSPYDVSPFE